MIQIQFTHFPGYEPFTEERGWRHLSTPHRSMHDDAVLNLGDSEDDPIMQMVDWAIDNHPDVFGVATDVCDHAAVMGLLARNYNVAFVEDASQGLSPDFVAHSFDLWRAGGVRFTTSDDVVG